MPSLIAKSASGDLLPLSVGGLVLTNAAPDRLTAVAPWPGQIGTVTGVLEAAGLAWPAPDRAGAGRKGLSLWSGRDQMFLVGAAPPRGLAAHAALTDVSDAWTALTLTGPGAGDVLARLVAIDLSPQAFPEGATARTGLGHLMALVHRAGPDSFAIYVFRSMTTSAVHEIEGAMKAVAARAAV